MTQTLILEIPEDMYVPLSEKARKTGMTPEELALRWLMTICTPIDDPIETFIWAFGSNIPDWADQHDKYIGQNLVRPN